MIFHDARILFGGYDLGADHSSINYEVGIRELNDTRFGHRAESVAAGITTINADGGGFVRMADDGTNVAIRGALGVADVPVTIVANPNDPAGSWVESFLAAVVTYRTQGQAGGLLAFTWQARAQGVLPMYGPTVGGDLTDVTADGVSPAQDLGPLPTAVDRLSVAVHVTRAAGTLPTLDLTIESDDDPAFATPTPRLVIPTFTGIGSAMRTIAGPIADSHWRASWTVGGTGAAFDFVLVFGHA